MSLCDHARDTGFGHNKRSGQIDVYYAAKILGGHIQQGSTLDHPRIVDQNVHRPQVGRDPGYHVLDGGLVSDVAKIAPRMDSPRGVLGLSGLQPVRTVAVKGNFGARAGQSDGHGKADPMAGPGDQSNFSL